MIRRFPGIAGFVDRLLDLAVVPGFSRIGYSLRRRMFGWKLPDLAGRSVMVTGASSGLGLAAAIDLARCGARVHMVCRSEAKGEHALSQVNAAGGDRGTGRDAVLHLCDLSLVGEIRRFAAGFLDSGAKLDVLVNNAGVMPPARFATSEGFELTFATNVLGPFLLTELLLPRLREGRDPRVILMSSGGMYSSGFNLADPQLTAKEYRPTSFYAHTKRAEVMLADQWQRQEPEEGGTFCSMHPGWAVTPGMTAAMPGFHRLAGAILRDANEGADTAVWLAGASPEEAPGGCFYEDRRPRPKAKIPGTEGGPGDESRLIALLAGMVAVP